MIYLGSLKEDLILLHSHLTKSFWDIECEDNAFITLSTSSGVVATLHSSATQWKHKFLLEIEMEKGYINLDGILSQTEVMHQRNHCWSRETKITI